MRTELSLSGIDSRSSIQVALFPQPTETLSVGDAEYLNEIRLKTHSLQEVSGDVTIRHAPVFVGFICYREKLTLSREGHNSIIRNRRLK